MKLIRFGEPGHEKPGLLLDDGMRVDTSVVVGDYDEAFFGGEGLEQLRQWAVTEASAAPVVDSSERLGPPIHRPGKIVCIGLNYADHAKESGAPIPDEPILFFKATSAVCGPNDPVVIPRSSRKTDWEVELAVVIGRKATYAEESNAMSHVAGYLLHNDYSEREWQLERGGQWVKGKSCDTFAPLGPFLATPDEIPNPHQLPCRLSVNGELRQDSSTAQMIFGIPKLISYVSSFMSLLPGDIISTGTPPGVGLGLKPEPVFLKPGDVVELSIDGLGTQRQHAMAAA